MNKKDRVTLSVFVCVCCCIHVFLGYDSIQSITSMFVKALNGTSHRPNLSHFYFSFQSSNVSNCVCVCVRICGKCKHCLEVFFIIGSFVCFCRTIW